MDNREFEYDDISGQILTETVKGETQKAIKKSYQYDSDGLTTGFAIKVGDKTQLALAYEYDGESKLQTVRQTDGGADRLVVSYEYDANGALIRENGRKIRTDYRYNVGGTLSQMVNHSGDGVLLSRYDADYQKNGQKTKETEEVRGTDGITEKSSSGYRYDCLGRLTKETHTGTGEINYTYDAHNNRKEMTTEDQIISYKYNKNGELLRTDTLNRKTERDDVTLYRQDANGNQLATIKRKKIDRTKQGPQFDLNVTLGANRLNENVVNHYNAWNQNTETLTKNYKVQYTYDDEGLRSSKTVNGKKTVYIWDGDRLVMELDAKGNVKRRYIWGQNLACTDTGMGTETKHYVLDPHGSVVQLVNDDGSIARRYRYDAFGNETKPDQKDDNPFRYCGEYYNKETDTLYLRAREYDAGTGRFLTADTYTGEAEDIGSLNLYTYCYNDSVNMVDPTGHWGRHREKGIKGKVFTHRFMTEMAYPVTMAVAVTEAVAKMKFQSLKNWQYSKILDGTILPDFVRSGSPGIYQSVYGNKKGDLYKGYEKYKTKKLMKYSLFIAGNKKKDEKVNNIFHGKSEKALEDLKKEAKKEIAAADKSKTDAGEKSLFLGCVLHSIQDYYAHSYKGDLQEFKDKKGKGVSQEKIQFNIDWVKYPYKVHESKKYKKKRRNLHTKTKDNPYSEFGLNEEGKWDWISTKEPTEEELENDKKNSIKKNERYEAAYCATVSYLLELLVKIK